MDKQQVKQIALDIIEGKIFGSWMIPEEIMDATLPIIFMPLACGAKPPDTTCGLYQYFNKSKHQTQSGYPIFTSMCFLEKDDLESLNSMIEQIKNIRKDFLERE